MDALAEAGVTMGFTRQEALELVTQLVLGSAKLAALPGSHPAILRELRSVLEGIDDFSLENTERIVHAWIEEKGYGMGQVMNTLRLALVGAGKGPGMYDVTSFIGKEETLRRIDNLLTNLKPAIE